MAENVIKATSAEQVGRHIELLTSRPHNWFAVDRLGLSTPSQDVPGDLLIYDAFFRIRRTLQGPQRLLHLSPIYPVPIFGTAHIPTDNGRQFAVVDVPVNPLKIISTQVAIHDIPPPLDLESEKDFYMTVIRQGVWDILSGNEEMRGVSAELRARALAQMAVGA